MINKLIFLLKIVFTFFFTVNYSFANLQDNLLEKFISTKTLSFSFIQKIGQNEEMGNCFIKYPLLMKCNYQNAKEKILISNGKTLAIIKKKYKKIYYYPLESTPLFIILEKKIIINLIKKNKPIAISKDIIEFNFIDKKENEIKIFFDRKSLEFKGWETRDVYNNDVSFIISNLKTNHQIIDDFFKIPKENEL